MDTLKPTAADVINAARETLDVICKVRGIKFEDLDEAMVDTLLLSSFNEYLGGGVLAADPLGRKRS
ncbi:MULTISPECIES: hypothetical protein [Paraburkholderia]|uniref:hypothetical protein n=1 Tax=Paraburkholderia TaxID=1822464 RepID=UPI00035EA594|nr:MULTISPECIES: hypothetical protein [Paraburkholderia]MDH6147180.1 hypothetical protein [Paraburkholderia sp. WSM4179]